MMTIPEIKLSKEKLRAPRASIRVFKDKSKVGKGKKVKVSQIKVFQDFMSSHNQPLEEISTMGKVMTTTLKCTPAHTP